MGHIRNQILCWNKEKFGSISHCRSTLGITLVLLGVVDIAVRRKLIDLLTSKLHSVKNKMKQPPEEMDFIKKLSYFILHLFFLSMKLSSFSLDLPFPHLQNRSSVKKLQFLKIKTLEKILYD